MNLRTIALCAIALLCLVPKSRAAIDTLDIPKIINLAKVKPQSSKSKIWVVYHAPQDLVKLEKEGFSIVKTKVKLVRNNAFWSEMWKSSLNMAMSYIVLKGGLNEQATPLAIPFTQPEQPKMYD